MGLLRTIPKIPWYIFDTFDDQGEQILATYLRGGGKAHDIVDDPEWTAYMRAHGDLRKALANRIMTEASDIHHRKHVIVSKNKGRVPISTTFHYEFPDNSDFTGYALLHGTDRTVGDFQIRGWGDVRDGIHPEDGAYDTPAPDAYYIEFDLRFVFNDIVNPNHSYRRDSARSILAELITLGGATSYRLSISWGSKCRAKFRPGYPTSFAGYPFDYGPIVKPLPRGTLDWAASERKRAKEIEAKIISELKREIPVRDTARLAERKRKLLQMFSSLSGYMAIEYLDRFERAATYDELPRLMRERLSTELRAELIDALNGKSTVRQR